MDIEWRPVNGYEGKYEVSNTGMVRSLNYNKTGCIQILKPLSNKGYFKVFLCKDGKRKQFTVHRLVAQAFIPNPDNLPCVNHKDENKQNNTVENLEWCTVEYNTNYGTSVERNHQQLINGVRSKRVLQYSQDGTLIKEYPSLGEINRLYGYHKGCISNVCLGRQKLAYGFKWRYAS